MFPMKKLESVMKLVGPRYSYQYLSERVTGCYWFWIDVDNAVKAITRKIRFTAGLGDF